MSKFYLTCIIVTVSAMVIGLIVGCICRHREDKANMERLKKGQGYKPYSALAKNDWELTHTGDPDIDIPVQLTLIHWHMHNHDLYH